VAAQIQCQVIARRDCDFVLDSGEKLSSNLVDPGVQLDE